MVSNNNLKLGSGGINPGINVATGANMGTGINMLGNLNNKGVGFTYHAPKNNTQTKDITYNKNYPGFDKEDYEILLNMANKSGLTGQDKKDLMDELYMQYLPQVNQKHMLDERQQVIKEQAYETKNLEGNDKNIQDTQVKLADLSQKAKKKFGIDASTSDEEVINAMANNIPNGGQLLENYINNGDRELLYEAGLASDSNRSRFQLIHNNNGERNDDILGHFETENYKDSKNKVGTWFKNLGKSAYNLASDVVNIVANPVDTLNNLSKAAVGGAMNLVGLDDKLGEEGWLAEANKVADGMGDFLKDRYGGVDQIANTLYQDPAGLISDIAAVVTGGAGLAKGAATGVAKTAALTGAKTTAKNAGKVANVANKVMKAGIKYDPVTVMGEGVYDLAKGTKNLAVKGVQGVGQLGDNIGEWGAKKITGTTKAQDKLYKAQEPRMNVLSNKKNLEQRRANSDRANELIVENGHTPTDTSSRLAAHESTMKKIWNQVEQKINGGEKIMIDQSQLAEVLGDYIKEQKDLGTSFNKGDLAKLQEELKTLEGKQIDLPTLEKKKQLYNAIINNWGEEKVSDVFANGLKKLTHEIGVIEDNALANIPGEFQKLKNDFGALKDTYEDVFKADMKNQRKKGQGLIESYSRIEGLGDITKGVLSIFNGGASDVVKGAGKVLMGKALAKSRDVDFLIKQGFDELSKQYKNGGFKGGELKEPKSLLKPRNTDGGVYNDLTEKVGGMNEDLTRQQINEIEDYINNNKNNLSREDYKLIKEAFDEQKELREQKYMERDFLENESKNILNSVMDEGTKEFKKRIYEIEQQEQNLGKVAGKKVNREYHNKQLLRRLKKKERLIEEMQEYYGIDQFEAADMYDKLNNNTRLSDIR